MKKYRMLSFLLTAVFALSCCPQGIAYAAEAEDASKPSANSEEQDESEPKEPESDESEKDDPLSEVPEQFRSDPADPEKEEPETDEPEQDDSMSEVPEQFRSDPADSEKEEPKKLDPDEEDTIKDIYKYIISETGEMIYPDDTDEPYADYPYDMPYADPDDPYGKYEDPSGMYDYYDEEEPWADYPYDEPYADPYKYDPWSHYNPYEYTYPYMDPDKECRCGDNITWEIKQDTLYLNGYGPMWDMNEINESYDGKYVAWFPYAFNVSYVVMDDRITEITKEAFYSNDCIVDVHLPESLEKIGESAFRGCNSITYIDFPDGLKEIGEDAFEMTGLKEISLPDSVVKIGAGAFSVISNLKSVTIPSSVEYIGQRCFKDCPDLVTVNIPDTVAYIGSNVLDGCLEWFRQQKGDYAILGDGFLYKYLGSAVNVVLPNTVKHICEDAFTEQVEEEQYSWYTDATFYLRHVPRTDIEMIVIPETVKELPTSCFYSMTGLKTVILPDDLKEIPTRAFAFCSELNHVMLPDSVETINAAAFESCYALSDISIPEQLSYVGRDAFKGTEFLKKFGEYAVIGDGLLIAYRGSDSVLTLPEGIKTICSDAINSENITEITFPASLRRVLENGVRSRSLMKVNMNEGLEEIGYYGIVFSDACKSYRLPSSVQSLVDDSIRANNLKVIYGSNDSKAEEYATTRGVEFKTEEPKSSGPDMTLNLQKDVWSFGNNGENFDDEYYLTERDRGLVESFVNPRAKAFPDKWSGDCFGLALTVILAKNGALPANAFQEGAKCLHDLKPTKAVQSVINYYHCVQYSDKYIRANLVESKAQRFYRMIQSAERISEGESPFLLSFQTAEFAHAVVGYGLEHGEWEFGGRKYDSRILIWDPNFPSYLSEDACLYYDKASFSYCIPHYDIYVDRLQGSIGILQVLNDLSVLNAYQYPCEEILPSVYETGDVNGDGQVTVADAVMLARIAAEDTTLVCNEGQITRGDLDESGGVTMVDCTLLLRMLAQLDKKL